MTVTVTGTVTAELPWSFLRVLCCCAPEECKALLAVAGNAGDDEASLPAKLDRALRYAADLLQDTAVSEMFVSAPRLVGIGGFLGGCTAAAASSNVQH
jgi:hypothetical protein